MTGYGSTPSPSVTPTPQVSTTTGAPTPPPALPTTGPSSGWLIVTLGLMLLATGATLYYAVIRRQAHRRFEV